MSPDRKPSLILFLPEISDKSRLSFAATLKFTYSACLYGSLLFLCPCQSLLQGATKKNGTANLQPCTLHGKIRADCDLYYRTARGREF